MMNRERGSSILAGMLPAAAVAALVGGAVVYDMGAVRVSVDEKGKDGTSIHLVVPAALVSAGIHLVPDRELRKAAPEMGDEMRQWLPVLRAAAAELQNCPDGSLVTVTGPGEKVEITLHHRTLIVHVDSEDETVQVTVPLGLVESVAGWLERAAPRESSGYTLRSKPKGPVATVGVMRDVTRGRVAWATKKCTTA